MLGADDMVQKLQKDHPLRKLFEGMVEQVFMTDLGICNPRLTDYLGELLSEFVHVEQIYRLRRVDGDTICELSKMEADACLGPHFDALQRTRVVNRYIGDFTLFWVGVYPETLRPRLAGCDRMREYLLQGKRSYGIASDLATDNDDPPGALLRQLSAEFEACVHGLHLVRRGWEQMPGIASRN